MRWGLAPYFWKKSFKEVPATFNARAETIAEKPMFRNSFKRQRIIPGERIFEWTDQADGKQPHLFTAADGWPILAFARALGSLDQTRIKKGNPYPACTVIVSGASDG